MKRLFLLLILSILSFNIVNAQFDKAKLEKKIEEAVAKDKAEKEAKAAKEASDRARREQFRTQQVTKFNNIMNNLNQKSAEDYINNPHGLNINTNNNKNAEVQQAPTIVATPKTTKSNRSQGPFANSGKIGTPSFSGDNYTGDRYNLKPAGFVGTQQQKQQPQYQKPRMSSNEMRSRFTKPGRTMYPMINTRQANTLAKASMYSDSQQSNNTQNIGKAQTPQGVKTQKAPNRKKSAPSTITAQVPQKKKEPVREQVGINSIVIDNSKGLHPNTGQDNSSPDLAVPDIAKRKDATKAYKMQPSSHSQAHYLSDRDNKRPSGVVKLANGYRTLDEEAHMARKDAANGFGSFDNPREWDYIYNVEHIGNVKTSSRSVTSKR